MNRRLWGMVVVVLLTLGGVSFATGSREQAAQVLALAARGAAAVERATAALTWPVVAGLAGAFVVLGGVLVAIRRWRRRPRAGFAEPWRTVIELARKGQNAGAIARATGLSQDAVRIVLAPVAVDQIDPRGKSFRSSPPEGGSAPPTNPPGRSR